MYLQYYYTLHEYEWIIPATKFLPLYCKDLLDETPPVCKLGARARSGSTFAWNIINHIHSMIPMKIYESYDSLWNLWITWFRLTVSEVVSRGGCHRQSRGRLRLPSLPLKTPPPRPPTLALVWSLWRELYVVMTIVVWNNALMILVSLFHCVSFWQLCGLFSLTKQVDHLQGYRYLSCQSYMFCFENCTPEGEGEKRERVQISKQSTENLWYHKYLDPCSLVQMITITLNRK